MLIKNKIYEIEITSYTSEGNGVGRIESIAVFVPLSALGDKLLVKIIKTAKTYAVGKIEEILTPSPHRVSPPCPHFEKCGGCSLLHVSYEHQLWIKKQHVKDSVERIGGFSNIRVNDVIPAEKRFFYRNKMVFPIGGERFAAVGGFYAPKSHRIVETTQCMLGEAISGKALCAFVNFLNENGILPYNEETHKGLVRRLMIRCSRKNKEAMAVISVNGDDLPKSDELVERLVGIEDENYRFVSIILNINKEKNNLVLGKSNKVLFGRDALSDELMGLSFDISPNSFYQVNSYQTEVLYKKAIELANLTGEETVLDLYCGAGTIGLCCAEHAGKIVGVEVVPQAICDAQKNAKRNNIKDACFIAGKAEEAAPRLLEENLKPDVVIVDPPRKGLDSEAISAVCSMRPSRVVYVSCNPSTLARDLRAFSEKGYFADSVTPVDMFPNSAHVESVALLKPSAVI